MGEARCDSVRMPIVFAKTVSQTAMWSEQCQAGQLGSNGHRKAVFPADRSLERAHLTAPREHIMKLN